MSGPGFRKSKLDGIELCDWFDTGADELLRTLRAADRHSECPNFNPGSENQVGFWFRRQLHETVVHCWDIERALGCPTPIDPAVATDGVDEFLDVFLRTRGKQTLIAPLNLATDPPDRSWTLTPAARPGRVDVANGRSNDVATQLSGAPAELLLVLWGRLTISEARLTVVGDANVAASLTG